MLDELRKQADDESYDEDEELELVPGQENMPSDGRFLGMTPQQRFVIALMFLFVTCLVGSLWLLVTEKVMPPFLF